MKLLSVFSIAALLVLFAGCDGDGDGTTTETTTEETDSVEETKGPVTVESGWATVCPLCTLIAANFDISETGVIEATVDWTPGPSKMDLTLAHESTVSVKEAQAYPPATVIMQATQDLLDNGNNWQLFVYNPWNNSQAEIDFTVTFTPD
jgi:hypothetical protein